MQVREFFPKVQIFPKGPESYFVTSARMLPALPSPAAIAFLQISDFKFQISNFRFQI